MAIGAYIGLSTARLDVTLTQSWAVAIYEDEPAGPVDGIRYLGAHDGGGCVVMWERGPQLQVVDDRRLTDSGIWLRFVEEMASRRIDATEIDRRNCVRCVEGGLIASADYRPLAI
jgi:hypothetical protein